MQNCGNDTLQRFIESLIDTINDCDVGYEEDIVVKKDQIPFIISSLWQSFKAEPDIFKEFIEDLKRYFNYQINIIRPTNDYYGICDVNIYLYGNDFDEYNIPNYNYMISIFYDPRDWGCCQCTPDMKDYREDKQCCGHGCDWLASAFSLHKISDVYEYKWNGNEHDFWDFEDEFYKSETDLEEQKKKSDREHKIKQIQERIKADKQKLKELMESN